MPSAEMPPPPLRGDRIERHTDRVTTTTIVRKRAVIR
jgi:hypothetical protein